MLSKKKSLMAALMTLLLTAGFAASVEAFGWALVFTGVLMVSGSLLIVAVSPDDFSFGCKRLARNPRFLPGTESLDCLATSTSRHPPPHERDRTHRFGHY